MRNLIPRNIPIAFPIIAVSHVGWLLWRVWEFRTEPLSDKIWLQVVWLLIYTVCWIQLTRGRKWAANGYILLTALNLVLRFTLTNESWRNALTDALFPIDLLCSFVLFVFWRQLFPKKVSEAI